MLIHDKHTSIPQAKKLRNSNCPGQWLCNEVGHLCHASFLPAMAGQLCKELINFVTLNVTFRVKGHSGILS